MAALADDGAARHLLPGLALPDIAMPSTLGGSVSPARAGRLNVFYLYPWTGRPGLPDPPDWDNIPGAHGSTPEAQGFRDLYAEFESIGVAVYGISTQDSAFQSEFAQRQLLPFALLSDAGFDFQRALALPVFETGGVKYLKRLTLIARDGKIEHCCYPVSEPATHAADVLALVRKS